MKKKAILLATVFVTIFCFGQEKKSAERSTPPAKSYLIERTFLIVVKPSQTTIDDVIRTCSFLDLSIVEYKFDERRPDITEDCENPFSTALQINDYHPLRLKITWTAVNKMFENKALQALNQLPGVESVQLQ